MERRYATLVILARAKRALYDNQRWNLMSARHFGFQDSVNLCVDDAQLNSYAKELSDSARWLMVSCLKCFVAALVADSRAFAQLASTGA